MCGIYACFFNHAYPYGDQHSCLAKRGPDKYMEYKNSNCFMAFYRLAIVGGDHGMQPYLAQDCALICNGEIYNYVALAEKCGIEKPASDCHILIHMYRKFGIERMLDLIDGEFAFVLYDLAAGLVFAARDPTGVKPLYWSRAKDTYEFSSKIKALGIIRDVQHVEPRTLYILDLSTNVMSTQKYHEFIYRPDPSMNLRTIYAALVHAVEKRICQSDRPVGFLLSGGFDSSIVLSIALASGKLRVKPDVFTFGFSDDAPDVIAAGQMVAWLKGRYGYDCIKWHRVIESLDRGLDAIQPTISALESFDTTTIRASVPMWMISRYIAKNTSVKVVLSGEGSDELFAGYMYFKHSPNLHATHSEIVKLLNNLHYYDNLRADRSTADHGLEIRPPFLDRSLIEAVLTHDALGRNTHNTKDLIRTAVPVNMLPECIHYGKKEAFSDAVGLKWKDAIQKECEQLDHADGIGYATHIIPITSEMRAFQEMFQLSLCREGYTPFHITPALWLPNQDWIKTGIEPSARVLPSYNTPKYT